MAPRTYVAPLSFGLGDLVVSLPAIQALIAAGAEQRAGTWLVARSEQQALLSRRIVGLAGSVGEEDLEARTGVDRVVDLRDHPLQRDHWWGSREFEEAVGPLSINDILERICSDFGVRVDVSGPAPLGALPRPEVRDCVLLVAESDGPAKRWPASRWASLAAETKARGADVRLVTRSGTEGELRATGIEELRAPTLEDAVDLLTSCRAVVGVDTGLTHIAVQQRTPTVTLCRTRPVYFRPWPHCRAVVGAPCDPACVAAERDYAYNSRVSLQGFRWQPRTCPVGGRCIDAIEPERVSSALEELL